MGLSECPHCNGSLDVESCDSCGNYFPPGDLHETPNGKLCNSCQEEYAEELCS